MGALLDVPKTDKKSESGQGLDLRYGLSSMQGWRIEMEDAHCAKIGLPFGLDDWSFFAVFDGHAGQKASEYCAYNLLDTILQERYFFDNQIENKSKKNNLKQIDDKTSYVADPSIQNAKQQPSETQNDQDNSNEQTTTDDLSQTVKDEQTETQNEQSTDGKNDDSQKDQTDIDRPPKNEQGTNKDKLSNEDEFSCEKNNAEISEAIRCGFLALDEKLRAYDSDDKSGTTAVCTLISPTHLFFANCGDSRAVISRGGKLLFSTEDHKPVNPVERDRINKAGGTVMIQRVNGSLAVSRALGDFDYKKNHNKGPCEQLVSPEPEVCIKKRSPNDEFVVLACDGIWDVMTNEEICEIIRYQLTIEDDLVEICSLIIDICLNRHSRDNMSIIIVTFAQAPKISEAAKAQDAEFEEWIRNTSSKYFTENPSELDDPIAILHELMQYLEECNTVSQPLDMRIRLESKRELLRQLVNIRLL